MINIARKFLNAGASEKREIVQKRVNEILA